MPSMPPGAPDLSPVSPSAEEVFEYGKFLGMNINNNNDDDKELLWIAKEAMAAVSVFIYKSSHSSIENEDSSREK